MVIMAARRLMVIVVIRAIIAADDAELSMQCGVLVALMVAAELEVCL